VYVERVRDEVMTYEVMAAMRSLVSFNEILKSSEATSGCCPCSSLQLCSSMSHATQSRSATTVAVRLVSEKKGSSPHVVPATMLS
jgi:hypothetical protein